MWDKLFTSINILQKGMEASWTRDAVIRNNIANAETPGFKSSDVAFESIFIDTIASATGRGSFTPKLTREKHIPIGGIPTDLNARVVENKNSAMLFNENNVDVEAEQVKLAQNSLYYNTLLTKLNGDLARLKMAVRDGR